MTPGDDNADHTTDNSMALTWLALAAGLLPVAVVHICYLISVQTGQVPGCVPYLSGCTSISAAGRHGTAFFLFKAGMIPAAVLMAAYWLACRRWLMALGRADTGALRVIVTLGVISALFLVVYTVYLGSKGDFYNLMRRYGVNVHLSFGVLAQMLLVREIARGTPLLRIPRWIVHGKIALLVLLLGLGVASIPAGYLMPDKGRARNVIEWWFAAGMAGYYLLTACAWRVTAYRARLSAETGARRGNA